MAAGRATTPAHRRAPGYEMTRRTDFGYGHDEKQYRKKPDWQANSLHCPTRQHNRKTHLRKWNLFFPNRHRPRLGADSRTRRKKL
jgi:hypothetical protein